MQLRIWSTLHTMAWPEYLRTIVQLNGLINRFAKMIARKRNMICRVPVLGQDNTVKILSQSIDIWNNLICMCNRQIASRCKSSLYIHHDQSCIVHYFYSLKTEFAPKHSPKRKIFFTLFTKIK